MRNIFLIGFMGSGKSTVASALYEAYGMTVVEMDRVIAEQEGMSIPDIFEQYGETYFRDAETKLLTGLQGQKNQVISCGGGTVLRTENVAAMKNSGLVVLLTAKPETILERVKDDDNRPLLKGNKNISFITDMMTKRNDKYQEAADIVVETDGKQAVEICQEIFAQVDRTGE